MVQFFNVRVIGSGGSFNMLFSVVPRVGDYVLIKGKAKEKIRRVEKVTHIPCLERTSPDDISVEIEVGKEEERS